MKNLRKIVSFLVVFAMIFSMCMTVFATEATPKYSITVKTTDASSVSIAGKTYTAYRLFDVTYSGDNYAYTVTDEFKNFKYKKADDTEVSGKDLVDYIGTLTGSDKEAELQNVAKEALKFATADTTKVNTTFTAVGRAVTEADGISDTNIKEIAVIDVQKAGYYLVTGDAKALNNDEESNNQIVSACILTTADPKEEITVKADAPTVEKNIVTKEEKGTDKEELSKTNNAAIGDSVKFKVTSNVPDMKGYKKYYFVLKDTMSKGLEFDPSSVNIKIGNKVLDLDVKNEEDNTVQKRDYSLKYETDDNGETTIEIVFRNFIQYADNAGDKIVVTYSATVTEKAETTNTGNENKVDLTYSNNPNVTDDGDEDDEDKPGSNSTTGKTPESKTYTYVTELVLYKIDGKTNQPLTGAEFDITSNDVMNTVLVKKQEYVEAGENEIATHYALKDGTYTEKDPVREGDNADIDSYVDGVKKYLLKETVNRETKPAEGEYKVHVKVGEDGKVKLTGLKEGTYTIVETEAPDGYNKLDANAITPVGIAWNAPEENSTTCSWTYTNTDLENQVGINQLTVKNYSGTQLPETGGIGTTIFYIIGGILVVGAGVLLVTKKRMSK
ncbi:Cell wall surface anchor family protein [Lachnospiraceae bacterium TWA4]|nr:Cell wall surface anchor family protein [Lachnospiraceae bacterium TWA4]